jgi:hypothetical protein
MWIGLLKKQQWKVTTLCIQFQKASMSGWCLLLRCSPLELFAMSTLTPGFFNIERRTTHSKGWVVNKFYA